LYHNYRIQFRPIDCGANEEVPEGVKCELEFGQIFTGKVGFGSLGLGFGHWECESQTEKQNKKKTGTGIFKIWKNNRLGNGIWAKFGLGKWDFYLSFRTLNERCESSSKNFSLS